MDETQPGRFVLDTNTIISRLLLPSSVPAKAVQKALENGDLLFSLLSSRPLSFGAPEGRKTA